MDEIQATKANQGMCPNAFGGHTRLDKLEQSDLVGGSSQSEEMLFKATILDATNCYLFFGLGRNGFVAQEFQWAADYFFTVTSDNPDTWNPARKIQVSDVEYRSSRKDREYFQLTDADMQGLCFDRQYALSGLDRSMNISRFRKLLKAKRRNIIEANLEQVSEYLQTLRKQAAGRGEYLKPGTYQGDLVETLVTPTDESLASLLYPVRQVAQVIHRSPFRMPRRVQGHRDWSMLTGRPARSAGEQMDDALTKCFHFSQI